MRDDRFFRMILTLLAITSVVAFCAGGGCRDEAGARAALLGAGYTNIALGGWSWACGDDWTCTEFAAIGPTGLRVHGAVGCGLMLKACTIRTER